MKLALHTENVPGNLHQAAVMINRYGWAEYVLSMDYIGGSYTIVVLRMPADLVRKTRADNPAYVDDNSDLPSIEEK